MCQTCGCAVIYKGTVIPSVMVMPQSTVSGRVAVVTGANKGIGYFIALQLGLSKLFDHVLIACRDEGRASDAVKSLQAQCDACQISSAPLTLGDAASHSRFAKLVEENFGKVDVLVNNAAFAYKERDPTPFQDQCQPTLDVNFRGTVDLTEELLPLIQKGTDPRVVTVASQSGRLGQLSPHRQSQFSDPRLTMHQLQTLVDEFQKDVHEGVHKSNGWGNSNYGLSKLAMIAATKVWAREYPGVAINCCCPGYCQTDMTSQRGVRSPAEGAKNAVIPSTMKDPPTGQYFSDYTIAEW